jgi:AraC family transcriptional regulator
MDTYERIERSIDFIERNLREDLTLRQIAAEAYFSPYHYHRIFSGMAGDSVGEYIRKRRLTEAAQELIGSSKRVIDIALDFGFQSQEAFSRSFKKLFGLTPRAYRKKGVVLATLAKKRLDAGRLRHLSEGVTMEPKMVHKASFMVIGMEITTTLKSNWENRDIGKLWSKFLPRMDEVPNRINRSVAYGICGNISDEAPPTTEMTDETEYTELVCVEVSSLGRIPAGMVGRSIPDRTYAVFTHKGKLYPNLQHTYEYIYGTWLPRSGYEPDGAGDFELYDERFTTVDEPASEIDIYVPIKAPAIA